MNISFHSTTKPMKIVLNEYSSNHFILWSCYSLSNLSTHGLCGAMHESWVPLCHAFQVKVLFGYSRNGRDQTDIFDVKAEKRNVHPIHLFPLRGHALTSKLEHFQERGNNI